MIWWHGCLHGPSPRRCSGPARFPGQPCGPRFTTEALRILEEGVADPVDVDRVMREALGFRMGPFELLDLTGLDVSGKSCNPLRSISTGTHVPSLVAGSAQGGGGLFGRKTHRGFYRYENNKKIEPETGACPKNQPDKSVAGRRSNRPRQATGAAIDSQWRSDGRLSAAEDTMIVCSSGQ